MGAYVSIYVTCADSTQAQIIAEALVTEELVACVNILPEVLSIYRWQGRLERAAECAFIAKTRRSLAERVTARIKDLHSYDIPCVVAWPIVGGHAPYLDWIEAETRDGEAG